MTLNVIFADNKFYKLMRLFWIICFWALLAACSDDTRQNLPIRGNYFLRANLWKFYFVDSEGKSVIGLHPGSVLPTTRLGDSVNSQQGYVPDNFIDTIPSYLYNGNSNSVVFDKDKGLYYWMTTVPGYEYMTENQFYVNFTRTDVDTIRVKFKFITEGVIGGAMYARITEMYYNGVLVIKNDDYVNGDGIVIKKELPTMD